MDHADISTDTAARWSRFVTRNGLIDPDGRALAHLLAGYRQPGRHYHNLDHIRHCLNELDTVRDVCPDPDSVEAAVWFHDVVYDPPSKENEERSAAVADEMLPAIGMPAPRVALVHELILDTRHLQTPRTEAGRFMVDIDLSSMGQSPEGFDRDGRNIRQEFGHVADDVFYAGRVALFERLLARPSVFATQVFRDRYETAARDNLLRTLRKLKAAGA